MQEGSSNYGKIVLPHWAFLVFIPLGMTVLSVTAWLNPFPDPRADQFRQAVYFVLTEKGVQILFFVAWGLHAIQSVIALFVAIKVKQISNKTYIGLWFCLTLMYGYPALHQLLKT